MGMAVILILTQAIYIAGSPFINLPWGVDSYSVSGQDPKRIGLMVFLTVP